MSADENRPLTMDIIKQALERHADGIATVPTGKLSEATQIHSLVLSAVGSVDFILTVEDVLGRTLPEVALSCETLGDLLAIANEGLSEATDDYE